MRKVLLFLMVLCSMVFAENTIYTEGRYFGYMYEDGDLEINDSLPSDRSRWVFDDQGVCFIHTTNTGSVRQSTYWIDAESIEETDKGFSCTATSDAGNLRGFMFNSDFILIITDSFEAYGQEVFSIIVFKVKNYI